MANLDLFDYKLPEELIATVPAEPRDHSRLLALDRKSGEMSHLRFFELPSLLRDGDLLIVNDAKVVPARLSARRSTGGRAELLLVRRDPLSADEPPWPQGQDGSPAGRSHRWLAMIRARGRLKPGEKITVKSPAVEITLHEKHASGHWIVSFPENGPGLVEILEGGQVPLPPYIIRSRRQRGMPAEIPALDRQRYQSVFAEKPGAVAAPTAGLHFTTALLDRLRKKGIIVQRLSLMVGPGTFLPVRAERIEDHRMEAEFYHLPQQTADEVAAALSDRRRIIATGTTCCRVLEYVARTRQWCEHSGWTDLFVYPPFEFRAISALVTNFHLPRSTLLMLTAAFAGRQLILSAYEEALNQRYRFYSYGDAMFIY